MGYFPDIHTKCRREEIQTCMSISLLVSALHPGIVPDMIITSYLEKNWRASEKEDDDYIMWR